MSEYEDKTLKFLQNKPYDITLAANEPDHGPNPQGGQWSKYKIVENTYECASKDISGKEIPVEKKCDCFFASDKLHEKIQDGGFGEGYKLTIEKVYDTEIFKYPFFKVTPQGDGSKMESATMNDLVKDVANSMDVNKKSEPTKELTPGEKINILWEEREAAKAKSNPIDDLPF